MRLLLDTQIFIGWSLPHHHRDPFDRLLVAQTMIEQMILLSVDGVCDRYPVQRLW